MEIHGRFCFEKCFYLESNSLQSLWLAQKVANLSAKRPIHRLLNAQISQLAFGVAVTSGEHDRHHFEPIKGSEVANAPFGPDKPIADDPGTEAGA